MQLDHASTTPVPGEVSTIPTPAAIHADKPSGPTPGTRLVIFSALLLPSAVIPLLVLRRSINSLHRKIDELKGATSNLRFKSVMLELSVRREQHEQLRKMITETREGLAHLRGETQRVQAARASGDERVRDQIKELVASNR
jgi:ribosomal protein L29